MNKTKINYFLDILMIILFLVSALSGLFLFFFGEGYQGYQGGRNPNFKNSIFGLPRHSLKEIHNYSGILFFIIIFVHIILHFDWLLNMTKSFLRKKKEK